MIAILYQLVKLSLGSLHWFTSSRANAHMRKFDSYDDQLKALHATIKQLSETKPRSTDAFNLLTANMKLHRVSDQASKVEEKAEKAEQTFNQWAGLSGRLAAKLASVRGWTGRKIPYLAGVLDTGLAIGLIFWATGQDPSPVAQAVLTTLGRIPGL